jgi:signal transduction histidine kinase
MSYDRDTLLAENQRLQARIAVLQRFEQENQQLLEQVKRLVRVERSMIEFQDKLDAQVSCYRQLNSIAQRLKTTFEPQEILQIAMEFMLYDLNFERCVILARQEESAGESFQAILWEGYEGDEPTHIRLTETDWPFQEWLLDKDLLVNPAALAGFADFSCQTGIDAAILCGIRSQPIQLQYLILVGNTKKRAKLFSHVTPEADYLVVLSNLLAQVSGAIAQADLYQSTLAQAAKLRQTLAKLQFTQTQLIQTEKMSSLGQLVAGIAHEINNPVNFINGNITYAQTYAHDLLKLVEQYQQAYPTDIPTIATTLQTIDFDFLQRDFPQVIDSMQVGAKRIQEIVLSLRNFSRMDESEYKSVDLHTGIESTLLILQHRFKANHDRPAIELTREYGDLPAIECAAGLVNQVLMNLLSNAIDAMETACQSGLIEQPAITIRTTVADGGISISIIDNGTGIPETLRHRLFDPFFTTKPVGKGTGLGLSISYQIITEKHQGKLECFSTIGEGTEFRIWLPAQTAKTANATVPTEC